MYMPSNSSGGPGVRSQACVDFEGGFLGESLLK